MIEVPERMRSAYHRVGASKDDPVARDAALAVARLALAWIFIYHGARTLFGAFGGPGVHQASIFYGTVAHLHPATFFTVLGGSIELFGGIAVALGIFGRLAAAGLAGDMVAAMATVTFGNGIVSNAPGAGYEINLALAGLATVVAVFGTGRLSLDEVVRSARRRAGSQPSGRVGYEDRPAHIPTS